ncbi:MAG: cupin domain-containing protein [Solirubrobacteraceae bacterium]
MPLDAPELVVAALTGGLGGAILGPLIARRRKRRDLRAAVLRGVSEVERARWAGAASINEFREAVVGLRASALVAASNREVVERYIFLAYAARRASDDSWEMRGGEVKAGEGEISTPLSDITRDAAAAPVDHVSSAPTALQRMTTPVLGFASLRPPPIPLPRRGRLIWFVGVGVLRRPQPCRRRALRLAKEATMRARSVAAVAALVSLSAAGVAVATHVPQVDPGTVPTGFLAAHNHVADVPAKPLRRIARAQGGMDVFVQHVRLAAGTDTGWHTHPGPAVVTVVAGALTYEDACTRVTHGPAGPGQPGTGFVDSGFGHVHHAIAGPQGADFYVTYLLPHGSPHHVIPAQPPGACHQDDEGDDDEGDDD